MTIDTSFLGCNLVGFFWEKNHNDLACKVLKSLDSYLGNKQMGRTNSAARGCVIQIIKKRQPTRQKKIMTAKSAQFTPYLFRQK